MIAENSININAPKDYIFSIVVDLSLWPKILPHYRWVRYLEKSSTRNIVQMAAKRKWIPIKWTAVQEIDSKKMEVRFFHLKAFTKGMRVVWTFTSFTSGVTVKIQHDFESNIPLVGRFVANHIIGKFFIEYIANQTLMHMKRYIEQTHG